MDWSDLLAAQETPENLLQHHSLKASIFQHSAFFMVQLSQQYMTTGKTIALTIWAFVGKVMSLQISLQEGEHPETEGALGPGGKAQDSPVLAPGGWIPSGSSQHRVVFTESGRHMTNILAAV